MKKKSVGHGNPFVEKSKMDKMADKSRGIKEGSAKDKAMDKKIGKKLFGKKKKKDK